MDYEDVLKKSSEYADMPLEEMELAVSCFFHSLRTMMNELNKCVSIPDFGEFVVGFNGAEPFVRFEADFFTWKIPTDGMEKTALWRKEFYWQGRENDWLWDKSRLIHKIRNQRKTLRHYEARINELLPGPAAVPGRDSPVDAQKCPSGASSDETRPDTQAAPENGREGQ